MADLDGAYAGLRRVLEPFADRLVATRDEAHVLYLDTPHVQPNRKPLFFGAVERKTSHVSFHLMPVYREPALLDPVSPGLKARMHGKSCFNFSGVEPALFDELAALVQAGFDRYREQGFVR